MLDDFDPASSSASNESASFLLQQALLMWPSVLKSLLEAAGLDSAVTRPPWTNVITALNAVHDGSFIQAAMSSSSSTPYLSKLELIYVERAASLWKGDKIQGWILANAQHLVTAIQSKQYSTNDLQKFKDARTRYLLSIPFPSVVKSLQKSAYSDHVPHLPPELLMAQQVPVDHHADRARAHREQLSEAGLQQLNVQQHPLRVFLESLMPWFVAPDGSEGPHAVDGGDGVPANIDEAVARMQAMPVEQREAMIRDLMQQAAGEEAEEIAEMEAALQAEIQHPTTDEDGNPIEGGINYDDYQFEDEEEQHHQQ